jgi:hypothetical protein
VQLLLDHGVDPEGVGTRHPIYEGRTPSQEAALWGYPEILEQLRSAGATSGLDHLDAPRPRPLLRRDPGRLGRAPQSDRSRGTPRRPRGPIVKLGCAPAAHDTSTGAPVAEVAEHTSVRASARSS